LFLAITATILIIFGSTRPLGVSPDSTVYIDAARNLASGEGLVARGEPLTHYPPGYPFFMTLAVWISGDVFPAANWLHAGLFLLNGLLVAVFVFFASGKCYMPAILSTLAFFASPAMFQIHSMAWSEALFLSLGLLSALMLALYISRRNRRFLAASGIFLGAALLTRYIGIVLLPTAWICLLWFNGRSPRRKWADVGWITLLAGTPMGFFLLYNRLFAGSITGRSLAVHFPGIMQIKTLLATLFDFWLPLDITRWLKLLILAILAGLILWSVWDTRIEAKDSPANFFSNYTGVFGVTLIFFYLGFLAVSISFLDAFTPLDRRILSPVLVAFLILLLGPVWKSLGDHKKTWLQCFISCFVVISLVINFHLSARWIEGWRTEGMDYSNTIWTRMEIIEKVKELGDEYKVYSNAQDVFIYLTQKPIKQLPYRTNPTSLLENPNYGWEMQAMCRDVQEHKAYIVMIVQENWRWYYPTVEEILTTCGNLSSIPLGEGILIGDMISP